MNKNRRVYFKDSYSTKEDILKGIIEEEKKLLDKQIDRIYEFDPLVTYCFPILPIRSVVVGDMLHIHVIHKDYGLLPLPYKLVTVPHIIHSEIPDIR